MSFSVLRNFPWSEVNSTSNGIFSTSDFCPGFPARPPAPAPPPHVPPPPPRRPSRARRPGGKTFFRQRSPAHRSDRIHVVVHQNVERIFNGLQLLSEFGCRVRLRQRRLIFVKAQVEWL